MYKYTSLLLMVLFVFSGCSTLSSPFVSLAPDFSALPEADMRALAANIERTVQAGNRDTIVENRGVLNVSSDEIRHAIRTRCARAELVKDMLDQGFVFEDSKGLITVIRNQDYKARTTSKERDRHAMIVMGENSNRWTIYEGVMKDSNLEPRSLSAIQAIFNQERVKLMSSGQLYEDAEGNRVAK